MKKNLLIILLSIFLFICFSTVCAENTCDCADLLERIERLEAILLQNSTGSSTNQIKNNNAVVPSTGETQTGSGLQVTLLESEISNGRLTATFRIENISTQDKTLSTLMDWSAKDGEGEKLDVDWLNSTLDGKLIPGDFMKGKIIFKGVKTMPVHIQFNPDLWGGTTLHFYIK